MEEQKEGLPTVFSNMQEYWKASNTRRLLSTWWLQIKRDLRVYGGAFLDTPLSSNWWDDPGWKDFKKDRQRLYDEQDIPPDNVID